MKIILFDAYNIIHALPSLKRLLARSIYIAQMQLVEMVSRYCSLEDTQAYIVFDAYRKEGEEIREKVSPLITVVYTAKGKTADSFIESFIIRNKSKHSYVYVVTSDLAQGMTVLSENVIPLSPKRFFHNIDASLELFNKKYSPQSTPFMYYPISGDLLKKIQKRNIKD